MMQDAQLLIWGGVPDLQDLVRGTYHHPRRSLAKRVAVGLLYPHPPTTGQEMRRSIEVRTKLTEGGSFTVLGEVELLHLGLDAIQMGGDRINTYPI